MKNRVPFLDLNKSVKEAYEVKLEPDEQNALETWRAQCDEDPQTEAQFCQEQQRLLQTAYAQMVGAKEVEFRILSLDDDLNITEQTRVCTGMIELEQLLSLFEDVSLVSFSLCILNKKIFRISKNH